MILRSDVQQGTPEWEQLRLGIPTASCFDRIMTPKKLEASAGQAAYRNHLLAEWLLGYALDLGNSSGYTQRGTHMEAEARAFYEMQQDVEVQLVGFVLRDDGMVGGSPDALIGDDGGVDFKCPAIHTHIGYFLNPEALAAEYRSQVQGYMYLTERAWWDIQSYNPILPAVRVRVERDAKYLGVLDGHLAEFIRDLERAKDLLIDFKQVTPWQMRQQLAVA